MRAVDVVTISRQYGAGGAALAGRLGARLGWPVLDREIVHAAAAHLELPEATADTFDEYVLGLLERFGASFSLGTPELPATRAPERVVDPDVLARAAHAVVTAAAAAPPAVLVGHGAQCLLRARPRTLHVRVIAPLEQRAQTVAERDRLDLEGASVAAKRRDKDRERYLRHHFGCDPADPMLYGLVVNTAKMSIDDAADAIVALVDPPANGIDVVAR